MPQVYHNLLEQHARRVLTRALTNKALDAIRAKAEADAASISLPSDLHRQVVAALKRQSDTPWDIAVAEIAGKGARQEWHGIGCDFSRNRAGLCHALLQTTAARLAIWAAGDRD